MVKGVAEGILGDVERGIRRWCMMMLCLERVRYLMRKSDVDLVIDEEDIARSAMWKVCSMAEHVPSPKFQRAAKWVQDLHNDV